MQSFNNQGVDVDEWFFGDDESLREAHSGDGITLSEQVAKIDALFTDWVHYEYNPAERIVLDPLIFMDVLTLESSMRRILNRGDDQYLLLDVWKAWAECSVDAGPTANLRSRLKFALALWELEANVIFEGSQLYARMLDDELTCFNWEAHEIMSPVLLEQLSTLRDQRRLMLESDSEARKNQLTLFDLGEENS
ncbi:UNVERIFIED_ORG: hypothetical protein J2X79_003724 [Arthrobacter globiformis]|nr:hypothetical protein [Arthrobacter globiformis]